MSGVNYQHILAFTGTIVIFLDNIALIVARSVDYNTIQIHYYHTI